MTTSNIQNFDGGWFFVNQLDETEGPYTTREQAVKAYEAAEQEFVATAFAVDAGWNEFLIASGVK